MHIINIQSELAVKRENLIILTVYLSNWIRESENHNWLWRWLQRQIICRSYWLRQFSIYFYLYPPIYSILVAYQLPREAAGPDKPLQQFRDRWSFMHSVHWSMQILWNQLMKAPDHTRGFHCPKKSLWFYTNIHNCTGAKWPAPFIRQPWSRKTGSIIASRGPAREWSTNNHLGRIDRFTWRRAIPIIQHQTNQIIQNNPRLIAGWTLFPFNCAGFAHLCAK